MADDMPTQTSSRSNAIIEIRSCSKDEGKLQVQVRGEVREGRLRKPEMQTDLECLAVMRPY